MSHFSIKDDHSSNHLTIHVPDSKNSFEGWFEVEVEVKAGGFNGRYEADFLIPEMLSLQSELQVIYDNLSGTLTFQAVEQQLGFKITGDGRGHFEAECEAQESFNGSRLIFTLRFDQTHIPRMIRELQELIDGAEGHHIS